MSYQETDVSDEQPILESEEVTVPNNDTGEDVPADSRDASDPVSEESLSDAQRLSDEELDRVADTAIETLREILAYFDAGEAAIDEYEGEEGELILDVVGANLAVLIGRYGKTLDALQFLVAALVNKKLDIRYPVVVDIEGYRNRRRQKLESMARSSAARCIRTKTMVHLRPMTPHDRRIIHIVLKNENRVLTESEGEEPNRYIVVKPC
ncbi:MAG: KH domain-containing protein [Coriobacteriales bacterium]|jgi:spoIIIJ-associated protein|nr:KH domain-containing protein [Coriobacteriales bacterium]